MGIPVDMCSLHDDGCEDDADHNNGGFDMEELMRNIVDED
jgi:hypothetical protein